MTSPSTSASTAPSRDSQADPGAVLDRVDLLASALLDHAISEEQIRELGELLAEDTTARRRYIENMQLHTDLVEHYSSRRKPTPVLGMLGDVANSIGIEPPAIVAPKLGS